MFDHREVCQQNRQSDPPGYFWGPPQTPDQPGQGRVLSSPPLSLYSHLPQSLEQLIAASREDLALCPGLGPQKVRMSLMGQWKEGAPNKWDLRSPSSKVWEGPPYFPYRWGKPRPREGKNQPSLTQCLGWNSDWATSPLTSRAPSELGVKGPEAHSGCVKHMADLMTGSLFFSLPPRPGGYLMSYTSPS